VNIQIDPHWNLLLNRVLWICFSAWFIAQFIKFIYNSIQKRNPEWHYFLSTGSMPSAHCALVSALATSVGIIEGLSSIMFAITGVLAIIVIYDAAGVRHTVGMQSAVLNRMLEEFFRGTPMIKERLKEFIGHTRLEVIAGIGLGILIGWLGTVVAT